MKVRIALVMMLVALPCAAAINVSFDKSRRYADAGMSGDEAVSNVREIATYIAGIAKRDLPTDADLNVEILDVDLAGDRRLVGRGVWIRHMDGTSDWPNIKVKFSLHVPGRAPMEAVDKISGEDYLMHGESLSYDPMRYEKLMIDAWFKYRIVEGRAVPAGR
jgi:Protein of unknown function (DUF3016)